MFDPSSSHAKTKHHPIPDWALLSTVFITGESGTTMDIRGMLGSDAGSAKYEVQAEDIVRDYSSMSLNTYEDRDCETNFTSLFAITVLLFVWLIINVIILRVRIARRRVKSGE